MHVSACSADRDSLESAAVIHPVISYSGVQKSETKQLKYFCFAFVLNYVLFFSLQMIISTSEFEGKVECLKNVNEFLCSFYFGFTLCPPAGMDPTSLCKTRWVLLPQHDLTVFLRASCDVTECSAPSVLKYPINVQWGWNQDRLDPSSSCCSMSPVPQTSRWCSVLLKLPRHHSSKH